MKILLAAALLTLSPALTLAQDAGKPAPTTPATPTIPATPISAQPAAPAAAQPAKADRTVDPEAKKLLDESREAVKKVRDISYTVKQQMKMGDNDQKGVGEVVVAIPEKIRGFPFTMYKVALHDEKGKATVEWAANGKQVQKLDHAGKKLLTMETKGDQGTPPQDLWPILPQWIMEDLFANPMTKLVSAKILPDAEFGGVKCKVVERIEEMLLPDMDAGEEPGAEKKPEKKAERKLVVTSVKFLGADDHLPRKFETKTAVEGGADEEGMSGWLMTGELKNLKANAGLKDADFTLKAPEGYAAEAGTYSSMGLQDPASNESPALKVKAGEAALAFKLPDADGKEVTLDSLKGRVVLLDFWATWCGPCKAAMPSIQKIHEKFADKPVSVFGVNTFERKADAGPKYMKDNKFTYGCLLKGDELANSYGITGIPTMILIDKDGKVLKTLVGFDEGEIDELNKLIEEALAKK